MKIFDIDSEIDELLELVDPATGELPEGVFEQINKLSMHKEKKIEFVMMKVKEQEMQVKSLTEFMSSMQDKKKNIDNRIQRTKKFLQSFEKGDYGRFTLAFRKTSKLENDGNYDIKKISDKYIKTVKSLDNAAIKKAIKEGEVIEHFKVTSGISTQVK